MKRFFLVRMTLVFLTLSFQGMAGESKPTAHPNIILVLADDMGYGDLGCYNPQSKIATPHIDRLAKEGMRFTDAHASGTTCIPSRYGLITGRYPWRPGGVGGVEKKPLIHEDQTTIASLLRANGYQTAMVGKWHLGFEMNGYDQKLKGGPVDRGFDSFFGIHASTDIPPYYFIRNDRVVAAPTHRIQANSSKGWSPIQGAFWREGDIAPGFELKDVLPHFIEEAEKVIIEHGIHSASSKKPLMLYLALTAPHTPWLPSPEFQGRSKAEMYGDFAMMVDAMVGRVLKALDDARMAGDTLVIFTSDNGPVWYPEDVQRTGHDAVGGLRGMKGSHWEGGHRMPFIVRWPEKVTAGSVSHHLICFTDVMATLSDAIGARLPDEAGPDSLSFLNVLLGKQPEERQVRDSLVIGKSLRSGPWKWIEGRESVLFGRREAGTIPAEGEPPGLLYHLSDDLLEKQNAALRHPAIADRLQMEIERIKETTRTRP